MRIYFLFIKCSKKYTETVKIDKPTKNIYCPPNRLSHQKSLKKPSVSLLCFKSHPTAPPDSATSQRHQPADKPRPPRATAHKTEYQQNALYLL